MVRRDVRFHDPGDLEIRNAPRPASTKQSQSKNLHEVHTVAAFDREQIRMTLNAQITWTAMAKLPFSLVSGQLQDWVETYVYTPELEALMNGVGLASAVWGRIYAQVALNFFEEWEAGHAWNYIKSLVRWKLDAPLAVRAVMMAVAGHVGRILTKFMGKETAKKAAVWAGSHVIGPVMVAADALLSAACIYELMQSRRDLVLTLTDAICGGG